MHVSNDTVLTAPPEPGEDGPAPPAELVPTEPVAFSIGWDGKTGDVEMTFSKSITRLVIAPEVAAAIGAKFMECAREGNAIKHPIAIASIALPDPGGRRN